MSSRGQRLWRHVPGSAAVLLATAALALPLLVAPSVAVASTPKWSRATVPEPTGTFTGKLLGTYCPSATSCYAVGWGSTPGSLLGTLVEHWDGTSWTAETSPNPTATGDDFPQLNAVTCLETTECTAVGTDLTYSNTSNTVVERWNGTKWSVIASPDVTGAVDNTFFGVACRTTKLCMAVGSSVTTSPDTDTLIEQWNGTSWSIDPSPNVTGALQTILNSVACPSAKDCIAVGYSLSSAGDLPLVEQWNGTTWSLGSPAIPTATIDSELTGVACPSTKNCVAVGRSYVNESSAATLAEHWNGTSWSVVDTPNPTGVLGDFLVSVSCPSSTTCQAAGESYLDSSGDSQTLVEQLSSGTWSLESSPNAPGVTTSLLSAVACAANSTSCVAVGQSYTPDEDHLLAISLSSGTWDLDSVPGPAAPAASYLQAAACSSAGCVAVGDDYPANSFNSDGLIEQWNGTSWTLDESAEPGGAVVTGLYGASCPSTTVCVAVGEVGIGTSGQDGQTSTFAETMSGSTWSAMTTSDPSGAEFVRLTSISCLGATTCTAVGWSEATPQDGSPIAFAESLSGSTWSLETVPMPSGAAATTLTGVSCSGSSTCTAVGSFVNSSGVAQDS